MSEGQGLGLYIYAKSPQYGEKSARHIEILFVRKVFDRTLASVVRRMIDCLLAEF